MHRAALELTLRAASDGYAAARAFRAPGSAAARPRGVPVTLDLPALTARGCIQGANTRLQPPETCEHDQ